MDEIGNSPTTKAMTLGRYACVLCVQLPESSYIEIRCLDTGLAESYPVPRIGAGNLPADAGRTPNLADLERLAARYACYDKVVAALFARGHLSRVAESLGYNEADVVSHWQALAVVEQAHMRGLLSGVELASTLTVEIA
jgi:hypothetical protein